MDKILAEKIEKFVLENEYAVGEEKRSVVSTYDLLNFINSLVSEPVSMDKDKILADIAELFEPKWGYNTKEQWLKLVYEILTANEQEDKKEEMPCINCGCGLRRLEQSSEPEGIRYCLGCNTFYMVTKATMYEIPAPLKEGK